MEPYFFQFPKVLMYGEQYKHLSSDAKLAIYGTERPARVFFA